MPELGSEKPFNSAEFPFIDQMHKNNIANFFISIKWIFSILLIFGSTQAFSFEPPKGLRKVDVNKYISNYEDYNNAVLNKKSATISPSTYNEPRLKIAESLVKDMKIDQKRSVELASLIYKEAKAFNIDPRIMIVIMKVESNFNQKAVNSFSCKKTKEKICGDYSIAQINYETWSKSFPRLGKRPLDFKKLKSDEGYAINRMAEILSILKSENGQDPLWFSRYHSATPKHKNRYTAALRTEMRKISRLGPNLLSNYSVASAR